MKQLSINKKDVCSIPEAWKELSSSQVKAICRLAGSTANPMHFKVQMFLIITGLSLVDRKPISPGNPDESGLLFFVRCPGQGTMLIDSADIEPVIRSLEFLFTPGKHKTFIESRLVENLFPSFLTRSFKRLYGPDSALYNITLAEFIRAETLYYQLSSDPDGQTLFRFAAALYRPGVKRSLKNTPLHVADPRKKFNDHMVSAHARYTRWLSIWQLTYIRLFYEGCRAFIIQKHPLAFSGSYEGDDQPKTVFEGFTGLVAALSDGDATRASRLRETLLWDVLCQVESLCLQHRKLSQSTNNNPKY